MSLDDFLAVKPASVEIQWPPGAATLSDEALVAVAVERFEAVYWAWLDRRDHFQVFGFGEPGFGDTGFWAAMRTPQANRSDEQRRVIHRCFELQEKVKAVSAQLETLRRVHAGKAARGALAVVAGDVRAMVAAQQLALGTAAATADAQELSLLPLGADDGNDGGGDSGSGSPAALAAPAFDFDPLAILDGLVDDEAEEQQYEHEAPRP